MADGKKAVRSEKIELKNVRLSFARIWKAQSFEEGQAPRYEATALLDPTDEEHAEQIKFVKSEATRIANEMWGDKWKGKRFLDGKSFGTENALKEVYDGYEGMFWVRLARKSEDGRPMIVDRDKTPLTEQDGKPYSGCYVNLTFQMWTQDNKFGNRINGQIRGIRFVRDGAAFSAAALGAADDEFGDDEDVGGGGSEDDYLDD